MGTTEDLARFIAETQYDDLPAEVVAAAKIGILDGVANLLAGSTQPVAQTRQRLYPGAGRHPCLQRHRPRLQDQPPERRVRQRCLRSLPGLRAARPALLPRHLIHPAGPTGPGRGPRRRQWQGADCGLCPGLGRPAAHRGGQPPRRRQPARLPPAGCLRPPGRHRLCRQDAQAQPGASADGARHRRVSHGRPVRQQRHDGQVHPSRQCRAHVDRGGAAGAPGLPQSRRHLRVAAGLCLSAVRRPLRLGRLPGRRRHGLPLSRSRLQHQALSGADRHAAGDQRHVRPA